MLSNGVIAGYHRTDGGQGVLAWPAIEGERGKLRAGRETQRIEEAGKIKVHFRAP